MEVNNLTDFEVDTNLLRKAVNAVLKGEKEKEKEISIAIVGTEKMKELSRIYRQKDYATDVLSFFYNERNFLGEIIICPEKVEKKEDFTKEICRVTIHGTLHLLGYDHENDKEEEGMKKKQEDYLKLVI
jgi:probable rRNA maturation factor